MNHSKLTGGWAALCLLASTLAAQPQAQDQNWICVAYHLGGPGSSRGDVYSLILPGLGWGPDATPPTWLAFRDSHDGDTVRLTLPARRERVDRILQVFASALPGSSRIAVGDTFGPSSPHVTVRLQAHGPRGDLAMALRKALQRIAPSSFGKIAGTGVVRKDTFECEDVWTITTPGYERFVPSNLPTEWRRDGMAVTFAGARRGRPGNTFGYFGGSPYWFTDADLEWIAPATEPQPPAGQPGEAIEATARRLLATGAEQLLERIRPAEGFEDLDGTGFRVCPHCHGKLRESSLFADSSRDRMDATLYTCPKDRLLYVEQSGSTYGPVRIEGR